MLLLITLGWFVSRHLPTGMRHPDHLDMMSTTPYFPRNWQGRQISGPSVLKKEDRASTSRELEFEPASPGRTW
ncbi:hypothetical protein M747DRAFT_295189 [Aspergillus niger ATCC 13496]|uniref:Uncharacterized protein n=1 Tax=Aspergillus niger ATCC 13496 TaxID=1353008 RepID=A0A370C436_ASPNG|nr:hypothetical protein M747DRAFT_295189 [Aspergillus niger ATCC 13496]